MLLIMAATKNVENGIRVFVECNATQIWFLLAFNGFVILERVMRQAGAAGMGLF